MRYVVLLPGNDDLDDLLEVCGLLAGGEHGATGMGAVEVRAAVGGTDTEAPA